MRAKRLVLATVITMSALLPPQELTAAIATINGSQLYTHCTVTDDKAPKDQWISVMTCLGYVAAIMDALSSGNSVNGFKACIPIDADMNQIMDVVKNFIRDHPEKRHLVAAGLVAEAFARAFPCRPTR